MHTHTNKLLIFALLIALSTKSVAQHATVSDSTLDKFISSIISQKDIKHIKDIDAGLWAMDGEPLMVENKKIQRKNIVTYDTENRDRLINCPFVINSGFVFTLNNRKYAFIAASFYNCVGSFCMESFHFIYDYSNNLLHEFATNAVPIGFEKLLGDINNDGQLDYLHVE